MNAACCYNHSRQSKSLLRLLLVHHSVGGESEGTTEKNDSVEANTRRSTVGCSSRCATRLRVTLGLWVAVLFVNVSRKLLPLPNMGAVFKWW